MQFKCPLLILNIWIFRETFKRAKFKSKQHQKLSLEKLFLFLKIILKFNSHLVRKQLCSPF